MKLVPKMSAETPADEVTRNSKTSPPLTRFLPRSKASKSPLRVFCLKTMYCCPAAAPVPAESNEAKRTQHSIVRFVGRGATLQAAVVGAGDVVGIALGRPPTNDAAGKLGASRRPTTNGGKPAEHD